MLFLLEILSVSDISVYHQLLITDIPLIIRVLLRVLGVNHLTNIHTNAKNFITLVGNFTLLDLSNLSEALLE